MGAILGFVLAAQLCFPQQPPAQPGQVAQAQAAQPAQPAPRSALVQSLRIIPLAGNGEHNDLERHVMAPLVVDVLDVNGKPVEGADVVFRFPVRGPSATFANQATSVTVRSNADGQAAATGWTANNQTGSFKVQVTATRGNEYAETAITMINGTQPDQEASKKKGWWSHKWVKIAIIAGGAAAATGIILATTGGDSSTSSAGGGIVITGSPGAPTIGAPR